MGQGTIVFCICILLAVVATPGDSREFCRFSVPASHITNVTSPRLTSYMNSKFAIFVPITRPPVTWLLNLLKITRLHNPTVKIYAFVHAAVFGVEPYLGQALANLRVNIRITDQFYTTGSSLMKLKTIGYEQKKDMVYLERFCGYYQAAMQEGISRIVTMDGDIAVFSPVAEALGPYTEDIVTACRFTSQLTVINDVPVLGKFCDFMANFFYRNVTELMDMVESVLGWPRKKYIDVFDMNMLELFVNTTPSVSAKYLCPEAPGVPLCSTRFAGCESSEAVQAIESMFKVRYNQRNRSEPFTACSNLTAFHEIIEWRPDWRGLPVPYHKRTGECFPMLHFQSGPCKEFIPEFWEHYREMVRKAVLGRTRGGAGREGSQGPGAVPHERQWLRRRELRQQAQLEPNVQLREVQEQPQQLRRRRAQELEWLRSWLEDEELPELVHTEGEGLE